MNFISLIVWTREQESGSLHPDLAVTEPPRPSEWECHFLSVRKDFFLCVIVKSRSSNVRWANGAELQIKTKLQQLIRMYLHRLLIVCLVLPHNSEANIVLLTCGLTVWYLFLPESPLLRVLPVSHVSGPHFQLQTSYLRVAENGKFDKTFKWQANTLLHTDDSELTGDLWPDFPSAVATANQLPASVSPVYNQLELYSPFAEIIISNWNVFLLIAV